MANGPDRVYADRTRQRNRQYIMTAKHHQAGSASPHSQWAQELTDDEEFRVFDVADFNQLEPVPDGEMFGLLSDAEGSIRFIGSEKEQLAYFPQPSPPVAWHGYPIVLRGSSAHVPTEKVWQRILEVGLTDEVRVGRLKKGKHA